METAGKQPGVGVGRELREAVDGSQWKEVVRLIHSSRCNETQRHWAIEEVVKHAPEQFVGDNISDILDDCADDRLDCVLPHLLTRRVWYGVKCVLQRDISTEQHNWAVEEAVEHAVDCDFIYDILPYCSNEELERGLVHLVTCDQWWSVGKVLGRGISTAQHRWAVEQASKHANDYQFYRHVLPQSHDEDIEHVMTHLVSRGLWKSVGKVLERDIGPAQHKWIVEQASKYANDSAFIRCILPQCHDEELEHAITYLVSQRLWSSVDKILDRGISTAQHKWAVRESLKHASETMFTYFILPHCTERELIQVLTHMVSRGLWEPVDSVTHSNITVTQHILSQLVSRGQWKAVGRFLQRNIGSAQRRWAVEEALKHADKNAPIESILPHCTEEELERVLLHMKSQDQWEPVHSDTHSDVSITQHILSQLVSRNMWQSVGRLLQRDISSEEHKWAVEQASRRADDDDFVRFILPHCHAKELEHVIARLVSQHQWKSAGKVLEQGVSAAKHRSVVEEASKYAADADFLRYVLPQCHEDLGHVLTGLVSDRRWRSVGKLLEQDISTTQHRWAVEQASKCAGSSDFLHYILPQCLDEELEHITAHLVSRRLWRLVDRILERGVATAQHSWALEEALKHGDEDTFANCILHHCTEEDLQHVLTHMVSRGLWEPIDSDRSGTRHHMLSQIVSRGLWEGVGRFLQRNISAAQHRWAVEQASIRSADEDFVGYILPQCHDEELEGVMVHLVSRGLWGSVGKVLERGINAAQHRQAVLEAAKHAADAIFLRSCLQHCSEDDVVAVFPLLVANRKWSCVQCVVYNVVCNELYTWLTSGHDSTVHDTLFWKFIRHYRVEMSQALDLTKAATQEIPHRSYDRSIVTVSSGFALRLSWQRALCESLMTSLAHTLCSVMCSDDREYTDSTEHTKLCVSDIYTQITACLKDNTDSIEDNILKTIQNKEKWTSVFTKIADTHKTDPLFLLHFLQGLNLYHVSRRGESDDDIFLVMLAVFPLFPQLQSVALRMMLHEKRWDVISQACLSLVWEHDRRRLFKAAVEQRQWSVVRQWSDHTVHDDQREWAMIEAFKEKEWMAYLLLADHGLTMPEQMHAHYMVAKYGDWDTVLQMVERGGDITEVSELLENWVTGNLRKKPQGDLTVFMKRGEKLIRMRLRFAKESVRSPMKALERGKWGSMLFNILHEPTEDYFSRVLDKVLEEQQWHILMHLVRLGMNSAERNWLFPEMVRQQQWGVCRMLLEYGVDDQLCVEALPELMERNQWTLVARVMEYNVDDAVRRQVMQCAFHRRVGALFWHCLNVMEDKQHLSMETQVKLFHQAISHDIWQAVKPLVEEKDGPGIQRRDMAFLEAIEQHLWDVVDYCQLHGADINMKDENGETPLHREARKKEWKAVEEIVLRDGKPNLLDKDGVSVPNRLIDHEQWDIVKIVIMYGGDIHLPAKYNEYRDKTHTPLQALIDARQMDVIHFTVMWCGDQKKGRNESGETVLHAACDSDRWDVMEDLIVRKVDPLAVTTAGQSPLVYAVLNTKCPERMVAECSKLGFSSHQPSVTAHQESLLDDIIRIISQMWENDDYFDCDAMRESVVTSPMVCAVLRDLPAVTRMLYESGSCSDTELVTLCAQLPKLIDLNTKEGKRLHKVVQTERGRIEEESGRIFADCYMQRYNRLKAVLEKYSGFLRKAATTPRALLSSCRLMISRGLNFRYRTRHEHVNDLPLSVPLKSYLEFADFLDPDYGKDIEG